MRVALHAGFSLVFLLFVAVLLPASVTTDHQPIDEALLWVRHFPAHRAEYDYTMTARVHLTFFWAGKDDVGGGYIRRGISRDDPHQEFFQVLFGSDPEKAPRAINRWVGGTEVSWHKAAPMSSPEDDVIASAFFGFMKSSQGKSASEMQAELQREKELDQHSLSRCYIYDAQENTLTLEKITAVPSLPVMLHGPKNSLVLNTTHKDLLQLDFVSAHKLTGKKVYLTILAGTLGSLRGVPVQISYQPNWWFQVVLNLLPENSPPPAPAMACR